MALSEAALSQYRALQEHAVVCRRSRTHVELTGDDRASFLHGLCTNHIKGLTVGGGCEAFLCNVQGKVIGFVDVFCRRDSLVIETVPGQGGALLAHLDRYLFRENVQLHDRSLEWDEVLLAGPAAEGVLRSLTADDLPSLPGGNADVTVAGRPLSVRRVDAIHPVTFQLVGPAIDVERVFETLRFPGVVACAPEVVEVARVERGTPEFGRDLTVENLPQEAGRDARAISFTKGCYLGQETVARIDALGHVNWLLGGLVFDPSGPAPEAGGQWTSQGKPLARITSVVYSPRREAHVALAFVRRGAGTTGAVLVADQGRATVVSLPLV